MYQLPPSHGWEGKEQRWPFNIYRHKGVDSGRGSDQDRIIGGRSNRAEPSEKGQVSNEVSHGEENIGPSDLLYGNRVRDSHRQRNRPCQAASPSRLSDEEIGRSSVEWWNTEKERMVEVTGNRSLHRMSAGSPCC